MHITTVGPRRCAARRTLGFLASVALAWSVGSVAAAGEVKVLAASAFRPVVAAMAPAFEKRTGDKVVVVSDTAEALAGRIRGGEEFDVAVLPAALLEALGEEGAVSGGSIIALARERAGAQGAVYAGAVSADSSSSHPALSLLILLASEDTQAILGRSGLAAP